MKSDTPKPKENLHLSRVIGDPNRPSPEEIKKLPSGLRVKGHFSGQRKKGKHQKKGSQSEQFGTKKNTESSAWSLVIFGGISLLFAIAAGFYWLESTQGKSGKTSNSSIQASNINSHRGIEIEPPIEYEISYKQAAENFAMSSNVDDRLKWVRFPDEVRSRLDEYSPDARDVPASILVRSGMSFNAGSSSHFFVANFEDGAQRLVAVTGTDEGPRVDWDAYALYNPISWEKILSGQAPEASVRVFLESSSHYNRTYEDPKVWSAYLISSPDLQAPLSGYTKRGSKLDQALSKSISGGRARVTLQLAIGPEDIQNLQVKISGIKHLGWVEDLKK
ncbi:hypothetical protein N9051_00955 [Akkermansiaceae bacterium]|nr:hypothetical protein [Akkermansiaceae bacterium]